MQCSAKWSSSKRALDLHLEQQQESKVATSHGNDMPQEHYAKYEPTILELKRKYEVAMKEKMLATIERDKLATRLEVAEATLHEGSRGGAVPAKSSTSVAATGTLSGGAAAPQGQRATGIAAAEATSGGGMNATAGNRRPAGAAGSLGTTSGSGTSVGSGWSTITGPQPRNPYDGAELPAAVGGKTLSLQKTFKVCNGHQCH
jgi:sperm-associated antigen 16 protein